MERVRIENVISEVVPQTKGLLDWSCCPLKRKIYLNQPPPIFYNSTLRFNSIYSYFGDNLLLIKDSVGDLCSTDVLHECYSVGLLL